MATGDQEITAKQIGFEILAGMGGGKLIKMFSKRFKKCLVGNSFAEGTPVSTPSGLVPIEEVQIGDLVYSFDEQTGKVVEQEVVHLIEGNKEHEIVTFKLVDDETVRVTDGHPFYVAANDDKWVQAENLSIGDALQNSNGVSVLIVDLVSEFSAEKVYNLTVANTHTYYVGDQKLLAHNSTCRIPHHARPRMDERSWEHIYRRHIPGGDVPSRQGDLFAPGTAREQIEEAARKLIASGKRQSDPSKVRQVFEKRMVINGKRAQYRIVVDSDDANKIITMFPIGR